MPAVLACLPAPAPSGQRVGYDRRDGQPLHPLRAPHGVNLARVAPPELFGVALEKELVERAPEAVDVEALERVLGQRVQTCSQVGGGDLCHVSRPQLPHRRGRQREGVVEQCAAVVDAREAPPPQHHSVAGLGVRPSRREGHCAGKREVVFGRRPLQRHAFMPPFHDARLLREEAVPAHVHAQAAVGDGARDAPDFVRGLEHGHVVAAVAAGEKLVGGG